MNDMQGILTEYLPLQLIRFGGVYATEGNPKVCLGEYDFVWRPIMEGGESEPQLYLGDSPMRFGVDGATDKAQYIKQALGDQKLRLPEVSGCWGSGSLMLCNELAQTLSFSPILGVTKTPAIITDAAGEERMEYTAISFHKIFFHERASMRLATVPASQRPIIRILLKSHSDTFLIHKSLLSEWKKLDIGTVCFDIKTQYQSFNTLCNLGMYFGSVGTVSFRTLDDFQHNREPIFWDELDHS